MVIDLNEWKRAREMQKRLVRARAERLQQLPWLEAIWSKVVFDDVDEYGEEE